MACGGQAREVTKKMNLKSRLRKMEKKLGIKETPLYICIHTDRTRLFHDKCKKQQKNIAEAKVGRLGYVVVETVCEESCEFYEECKLYGQECTK
jgi:hypothetical protein